MTISYPLSMPTVPGPVRVTLAAANQMAVLRSPFTFKTQVQEHPGKSWSAEVTLPLMERDQAEEWIAFLLSLHGQKGTFLLGDPTGRRPRGTAPGIPLVNGNQSANAIVLATKGWTASQTGILKKGDYIQIAQRLYKTLTDVNSDGSGLATIDIWPSLREAVVNNDAIYVNETKGLFRLATNLTGLFSADEAKLFNVSFSAIEAL